MFDIMALVPVVGGWVLLKTSRRAFDLVRTCAKMAYLLLLLCLIFLALRVKDLVSALESYSQTTT